MFVVTEDTKKGLSPTPTKWLKKSDTDGYYWPLYGLHFKIQNNVPLPVDPNILKKEWRHVSCSILLNGKTFETYESAEKAMQQILRDTKSKKMKEAENVKADKVESSELEQNEVSVEEIAVAEKSVEEMALEELPIGKVTIEDLAIEEVTIEEVTIEEVAVVEQVAAEGVVVEKVVVAEQASQVVENEVAGREHETNSNEDENFGYLPIANPKDFKGNELLLKNKTEFIQLGAFYLQINERLERKFFDKCVDKTFDDDFFLTEITFKKDSKRKKETDWIGVFDETLLYKFMKKAVVEKLEYNGLDDTKLKNIFIKNFDRIKRAKRATP